MRAFLLGLVGLLLAAFSHAAPLNLAPQWRLAEDPAAQWGLAEALAHDDQFTPATAARIAPGYGRAARWARLSLPADALTPGPVWLQMRMPRLEQVQLWQRRPDGSWLQMQAGQGLPHARWPLDTASATFPLERSAGEPLELLLRQSGRTAGSWDAQLCEPRDCRRAETGRVWLIALLIGSQLMVAAACLLLFGIWRQRSFWLIALYALAYAFYEFSQQGWGFQYLWPTATDWGPRCLNVLSTLALLLQSLSLHSMLDGPRLRHQTTRWLSPLWLAQLAAMAGSAWGDYLAWAPFTTLINLLSSLLMLGLGCWAWRRRLPQGGTLALVMLITVVGALPRYLHILGLLPYGVLALLSTPLAIFSTNLLLIAALVRRLAGLQGERLRAQAQLLDERAARQRELEQQVAQRTEQLSDALLAQRALHEQRSRLLAYIGHDLRAPLTATVSYLRLLGGRDRREQQLHASVEHGVAYQLALIDELVEFSRGELRELELVPAPVYLWGLLDELVQQGELLARAQGNRLVAQLAPGLPTVAVVDAKRLRQLLLNLLSNAAKFTRKGEILLTVAPGSGPGLYAFAVSDTGAGIDAARQAQLFEPFGASASAGAPRSGLGLAIARHISEAMGSTLSLHSELGVGSRFAFEIALPVASAEEVLQPGADVLAPVPLRPGLRALLIDSPLAHADRLAEILFAADLEVERAAVLPEAIEATLLLIDPLALDATGLARLNDWRAGPGQRLCIGLLSQPVEGPLAAAFDATLYKPVDAVALQAALRGLLDAGASPLG